MCPAPTVTTGYCRSVWQRPLETGALPRRTAGVSWWSRSSFLRYHLGPVWTYQKRRPLLVWEQTEWVSFSLKDFQYRNSWDTVCDLSHITVCDNTIHSYHVSQSSYDSFLLTLRCFSVCSQMRRSKWSATWRFMTSLLQSLVQRPLIYRRMYSYGGMVKIQDKLYIWLIDKPKKKREFLLNLWL